jgi:hypothetical protein
MEKMSSHEVLLPNDPSEGIDPTVLARISSFVIIEDELVAVRRCEALQYLMNEWLDVADGGAMAERWVRRYSGRDFAVAPDRNGHLRSHARPSRSLGGSGAIPAPLVQLLASRILGVSEDEGLVQISSIALLAGQWMGQLTDVDRLLGHLLRVHRSSAEFIDFDHDQLHAEHARLHSET